jgi:anti-sigma factor RsiW
MSGMACNEIVETITAYLEGTLAADDRERFDAHLLACGSCREYVAQMRDTITRLGTLDGPVLSPEAHERLSAAFRQWRS